MFIYLKEEVLNQYAEKKAYGTELSSISITNKNGSPYLEVTDDFDVLNQSNKIKECFLKATMVTFPNYTAKNYEFDREYGIYRLGKATAELTPGKNCRFVLKIETTSWNGIADMNTIQEKLWAGTIAPSVSYEKKQMSMHPLQILRELLSERKLNRFKRFILGIRLLKTAQS